MDDEFLGKCLVLEIEISEMGSAQRPWVVWKKVGRTWKLLCLTKDPSGYCDFLTKEEALESYVNNPGKYIWN